MKRTFLDEVFESRLQRSINNFTYINQLAIKEEHLELMKTDFDGRINRLEVDCIDNSAGYAVGNLALACHRCNFFKLNFFSFDEMREIAQKYFKPKWVARLTGSAKNA